MNFGALRHTAALLLGRCASPAHSSWATRRRRAPLAQHDVASCVRACRMHRQFTLGGAGKTPVARAVRAKLGPHAHTLSRGYGGRAIGPLRVTPDRRHGEVGDEKLLHARDGAAWIAREPLRGAMAAVHAGAHAIVMDDGFQNPSMMKDLQSSPWIPAMAWVMAKCSRGRCESDCLRG